MKKKIGGFFNNHRKINVCLFKLLNVNLCSQFKTSCIMVFVGICYWNPQDFNLIPRLTQPTPGLGTFKKKTSFTVYIQYISLSTDYQLLPIDPLPGEIHDVSFHLSILSFLRRCQANTSTCTHTAQAQFSQTGLELFGFYKFMFSIGMWPP